MAEPSGRSRSFLLAAAISAAVIAIIVLFANVTSTARVADHAQELHHVNATLGTAALARAAAGQAALFDELAGRVLASPEDARVARRELEETTSALRDLTGRAPGPVAAELEGLLAVLSTDPIDRAAVEARYAPSAERLEERISHLEAEIERSDRLGSYVSAAIRLLVVLIIPGAAIVVYRKRAAQQVREERITMEAQLEAEREISRAKDRFVAGMSHEMRTPLTGICGFAEVLLDAPPEAPFDREPVAVIHSEASELSRMVDDFIAASRIDGGTLEIEPEEVDLTDLAGAVAERFARIGTSVEVAGDEMPALCDTGRTRQILTNLLSNAAHHGGPRISVRVDTDAASVRCHVADDGPGIPAGMDDRLFTRYVYDGDEALTTGSLGLGTWVARELARAMGGEVTFRREDGLTVFTLTLPAAGPADEEAETPVEVGATA